MDEGLFFRETCLTDDQTFQALIDQITDLKMEKNVELRFIWMDMIHDIIETKVKVFSYCCSCGVFFGQIVIMLY